MYQHVSNSREKLVLVDPAAEIESKVEAIAPRLSSLQDKRIAIIDNTKHNADTFLEATRELLERKYQVAAVTTHRKFSASVPTPPEVIERLAQSCDAVIHGVAD
jgi:phosphoribosylpyrophosphate synthetase